MVTMSLGRCNIGFFVNKYCENSIDEIDMKFLKKMGSGNEGGQSKGGREEILQLKERLLSVIWS